jgi:hypothetical protein
MYVRGDDGTRTRDQGFADPCLTSLATSPYRLKIADWDCQSAMIFSVGVIQSGQRDSNP